MADVPLEGIELDKFVESLFYYILQCHCHFPFMLKHYVHVVQMPQLPFFVLIQGTTGHPKASLATHHILVNNAIASGKYLELDAQVLCVCVCVCVCVKFYIIHVNYSKEMTAHYRCSPDTGKK
jgi:hypothetical protein